MKLRDLGDPVDLTKLRERLDLQEQQPTYSLEEILAVVGAFAVWFAAVYGARAFWLWMTA